MHLVPRKRLTAKAIVLEVLNPVRRQARLSWRIVVLATCKPNIGRNGCSFLDDPLTDKIAYTDMWEALQSRDTLGPYQRIGILICRMMAQGEVDNEFKMQQDCRQQSLY
jgi:hypothetical protein